MKDDNQDDYHSYLEIEVEVNPDSEAICETMRYKFTCPINAWASVLSLYIAVSSVLLLAFGGVTLFEISPIASFVIWGVAILWFVGLIWYLPQRVYIQDITCTYPSDSTMRDSPTVKVEGRVSARHPEQIERVHLFLEKSEIGHQGNDSLPDRLSNVSYKFTVYSPIKQHMLGENNMGIICFTTCSRRWYNPPFTWRVDR